MINTIRQTTPSRYADKDHYSTGYQSLGSDHQTPNDVCPGNTYIDITKPGTIGLGWVYPRSRLGQMQ